MSKNKIGNRRRPEAKKGNMNQSFDQIGLREDVRVVYSEEPNPHDG